MAEAMAFLRDECAVRMIRYTDEKPSSSVIDTPRLLIHEELMCPVILSVGDVSDAPR